MWQKFIIEKHIKRSVILFNLFQMQRSEWHVVVVDFQWMTQSF